MSKLNNNNKKYSYALNKGDNTFYCVVNSLNRNTFGNSVIVRKNLGKLHLIKFVQFHYNGI